MTKNHDNRQQPTTTTKTSNNDKQQRHQTMTTKHTKTNATINLATTNDKSDKQ
jgi:hypothetical protein